MCRINLVQKQTTALEAKLYRQVETLQAEVNYLRSQSTI